MRIFIKLTLFTGLSLFYLKIATATPEETIEALRENFTKSPAEFKAWLNGLTCNEIREIDEDRIMHIGLTMDEGAINKLELLVKDISDCRREKEIISAYRNFEGQTESRIKKLSCRELMIIDDEIKVNQWAFRSPTEMYLRAIISTERLHKCQ